MSAPAQGRGRVLTFYSYKGGTGRSMMLANVAWILASNGRRVVAIDWDLEAPGLHRYFSPFLQDRDLTSTPGLMDLLVEYATSTVTAGPEPEPDPGWFQGYARRVLRHTVSLDWSFPGKGTLDFLPAGRQGAQYAALVNGFNWQRFYDEQGGGTFIEAMRTRLCEIYDYVLVDSRTGVSDTAGICTVQLPDVLVTCFTLNNQGIEGAAAVAASAHQQREKSGRPLAVFPVPMRIESGEQVKKQYRWALARRQLAPFPMLKTPDRESYWSAVAVPYNPFYAYEEVLASFGDQPGEIGGLLEPAERLASYLTDGEITSLVPPTEDERRDVLARYAGTRTDSSAPASLEELVLATEQTFGRLGEPAQQSARRLFLRLVQVAGVEEGGGIRTLRVSAQELSEEDRGIAALFVDTGSLAIARDERAGGDVIHLSSDALAEGWGRLQAWIEDDREFLLWRRRIAPSVSEWKETGYQRDALLTGARLDAARAWRRRREQDLSPGEWRYIKASEEAKSSRQRGVAVVALAALGVVALGGSYVAERFRDQAHRMREMEAASRVRAYISEARDFTQQGNPRAALARLDSAQAIDSANVDLFVQRGLAWNTLSNPQRADSAFTYALALDADNAGALEGRALARSQAGNRDGAVLDYVSLFLRDPHRSEIASELDALCKDTSNIHLSPPPRRRFAPSDFRRVYVTWSYDRSLPRNQLDQLRSDLEGRYVFVSQTDNGGAFRGDTTFVLYYDPCKVDEAHLVKEALRGALVKQGFAPIIKLERVQGNAGRSMIDILLGRLRPAPKDQRAP